MSSLVNSNADWKWHLGIHCFQGMAETLSEYNRDVPRRWGGDAAAGELDREIFAETYTIMAQQVALFFAGLVAMEEHLDADPDLRKRVMDEVRAQSRVTSPEELAEEMVRQVFGDQYELAGIEIVGGTEPEERN